MDTYAAEVLARHHIDEHLDGWRFAWDNARRRLGCCKYSRRTISLSKPLARQLDEAEVLDTILHEIAHAVAGHEAGHGPEWRAAARLLGANPQRCASVEVDHSDAPWKGECPNGHTTYAYRAPKRVKSCGKCSPRRFNKDVLLAWSKRGVPAVPRNASYRAELQRLGVTQANIANA